MKKLSSIIIVFLYCATVMAQSRPDATNHKIVGKVSSATGEVIESASLLLLKTKTGSKTDSSGSFSISNIKPGTYSLRASAVGYQANVQTLVLGQKTIDTLNFILQPNDNTSLNDVVVTGTLKEVQRLDSPIPVEVYTPSFFKKNPTASLFEAVGLINGVRPQLNCNICNTGDIHINGMEGAYTLILIDGMPIVSGLSTVYGLSGIPNSMVERIEVVKGPGGALYGSEAMGGIINVITKSPAKAPKLSLDVFGTTWQEYNADASTKFRLGKAESLFGLNYYYYQNRLDKNDDGFTDVTLQNRISLFNKWTFKRKNDRIASIGLRYVNEDRFGGDMNYTRQLRGSDSIYGESIYTKRFEVLGLYQLPLKEKFMLQYSYNWHDQNSYYGTTSYNAYQKIAFAQLYWDKQFGKKHDFLLGISYRKTFYDDNTPGTAGPDVTNPTNQPAKTPLPGVFVQDEYKINDKNTLLAGYRFDYDKIHGSIHSPRIAYKLSPNQNNTLRASFGTGFRVVNLFTEDHAALTGSRKVEITEELKPERSINTNLNYVLKIPSPDFFLNLDFTGFYSYFNNKITGDFDTDPNKIIYDNLKGHAISRGLSLNIDATFKFPLKVLAGITYQDVYQKEDDGTGTMVKTVQLYAPKWSGTFLIGYTLPKDFTIDLTGTYNGPMRLPIQPKDFRPEYSPWFSLVNIQLTKKFKSGIEIYGGVKNLFNFVPKYALIRTFDPFDKTASDPVSNPNGYTFDTEYNYAPLQGIRGFLGVRLAIN
ncbi:MAG: TonB-dependent receptor [Pedobacter sp.]|nr:MAG: TonB-dependent receptor [Pedobacter sp.]